jgi:hypothetical protein
MVDLDTLASLDSLIWLQTGQAVAERFTLHQSSVSRNQQRCTELFGVQMQKVEGEWSVLGDSTILNLEREVHQMARVLGHRPLRLEATYWSGPLLCSPTPEGWLLGTSNIVGVPRNLKLVRERVVDAWLAGLPDLPEQDDPDLTAIVLSTMPVHCLVAANHPLAQQPFEASRLSDFPSLALPENSYPKVEAGLKAMGLWSSPVRMTRYRRDRWEGLTETAATIGYGTALSEELARRHGQPPQVRLPINLPFHSGEALVVRRELVNQPVIQQLISTLRERLQPFSACFPEIQLVNDN